MMLFRKAIPRRTFLCGAGTALALPLLDSMIPAFAQPKPALRLGFVYCPNGMNMDKWWPTKEGSDYGLSPILQPLAAFRDDFLVLGGISQDVAYPRPGEGDNAPHERAGAAFLTGIHPTRGGQLQISVDQIAANELGKQTQLASLELGLHDPEIVGQCEKGWSCGVMRTLSWRNPTAALPIENNPRRVFERLFGESSSTDPAERLARIQKNRSLLDSITQAASRLMKDIGGPDRNKLSEYLDSIRDVERRIQTAEEQSTRNLPKMERPTGIPDRIDDYAKLMFDLEVLALQADFTRVVTFMMGREQSDRTFREIGIQDTHHQVSHHGNDPVKKEKYAQIGAFHSEMFGYLLGKLRALPDGDGSLLDHSLVVYGGGISEGNGHSYTDLPILLAGGKAAHISSGQYIRYSKGTQMTNLYATLLDKLGVAVDRVGDTTGRVELPSKA
jgi:uncharacterized protein DUF1552